MALKPRAMVLQSIAQMFMSLSLSIAVLGEVILPDTSLQIKTIAIRNWPDRTPGGKKEE